MDAIFKLSRSGLTDLVVTSLELDNDEYLDENLDTLVSVRNYAYSHTVTINILSHISVGDPKIKTHEVIKHFDGCVDESVFKMDVDGLFEVSHIILPNKKWYDYCVALGNNSGLENYKEIYIYDETVDKIMKKVSNEFEECSITDLLNAESSDKVLPTDLVTTVIKCQKSTFNIYYIRKCHAEICSRVLNSKISTCKTNYQMGDDILKRDVLFMAISCLKFAIDTQQFYEAQRILENISNCGLCNTQINSCNCNKYGSN